MKDIHERSFSEDKSAHQVLEKAINLVDVPSKQQQHSEKMLYKAPVRLRRMAT